MFKPKTRSLVGNTKKEQTREELLEQVRAERAERTEGRKRSQAATHIQAAWRGAVARAKARTGLLSNALSEYVPLVAQQQQQLEASRVAGSLIPVFLFLAKPPPATSSEPLLLIPPNARSSNSVAPSPRKVKSGIPAASAAAAVAAASAIPAPPSPGGSAQPSSSGAAGSSSSSSVGVLSACRAQEAAGLPKLVRAVLALLLRSFSCPTPTHNYLWLLATQAVGPTAGPTAGSTNSALAGPEGSAPSSSASPKPSGGAAAAGAVTGAHGYQDSGLLLQQAFRLLRACCGLMGAPSGPTSAAAAGPAGASAVAGGGGAPGQAGPAARDAVVEAAAVRLLSILCDPLLWKFEGSPGLKARGASQLQALLAQQPAALFAALSRELGSSLSAPASSTTPTGATAGASVTSASSIPRPPSASPLGATPGAGPSLGGTSTSAGAPAAAAAAGAAGPAGAQGTGTAAGAPQASPHAQRLLTLALGVLQAGLPTASAGQSTGTGAGTAGAGAGSSEPCVAAFVRLVLLVPGTAEALPEDVKAQLRSPEILTLLCSLLVRLAGQGAPIPLAQQVSGVEALWGLANLTLLVAGQYSTAVLPGGTGSTSARRYAHVMHDARHMADPAAAEAYCRAAAVLLTAAVPAVQCASGAKLVSAGCAAARLWPLAQRPLILQLLTSLEASPCGFELLACVYAGAMELLPDLGKRLSSAGHSSVAADIPPLLSAVSFTPGLLPRLWRWLARAVGLPLEAPLAATRGLDVLTLAQGYRGLAPGVALGFGLFCRLYCHLLMVVDDSEFYDGSTAASGTSGGGGSTAAAAGAAGGLSLGQARAVSVSLNSLVYHTYLPAKQQAVHAVQGPGLASVSGLLAQEATALLAEHAPLLLRSLYERDVRRPFCQRLVWLAPYREMFGASEETPAPPPPPPQDEAGGHPAAPDPGAARIAGFTAANVLQALIFNARGGEGAEGEGEDGAGDEAPGPLQSRPAEGARPASLASLLRTAPQAVPFARRVELFRALLSEDKARGRFDRPVYEGGAQPIKATIRRASLMEDAYAALAGAGSALKARLVVTFINAQGLSEAGLDYGGLMKEFLEEVCATGFHADYGLFSTNSDGALYPRPSADRLEQGLQLLEFLGLMVGKALYEGILLNVALAPFFVTRLQGRTPMLDDLRALDPDLHRSILQVKNYEGDVEDLGLTFSVEDDFFGQTTTYALLPGHANTPVTNDNRLLYCHLLADWHLNVRLGRAAEAFARGLSALIPPASLRLFNPTELNQLISGEGEEGGSAMDVQDMRRYVRYSGGYRDDSTSVKLFWQVVSEMQPKELGQLLKFVTSCSRAPLGGFRYLQPPLTIHKVDCEASMLAVIGGKDVDRLPSASTCYNMLKLPNYRRKETLKKKLLYAISSGAGFELS